MNQSPTRRSVLRTATIGSIGALAGCLGDGESEREPTDADQSPTMSTDDPGAGSDDESSLELWLESANVVGGTADYRRDDEVHVAVGGHDVPFSFHPALVWITPGTTVTWEWTGFGGPNNVVAVDRRFDSGSPTESGDHAFSHTFEDPGTYRYVSEPHRECGMKGAVRVERFSGSAYPTVDEHLLDADNYDGTIADRIGRDTASVRVGVEGNGGNFAFDPPALKVSAGTTVRWEWTGNGGAHDVAFESIDVESELLAESGETFTHRFDESGVYLYVCHPHKALGMRGAVVVP